MDGCGLRLVGEVRGCRPTRLWEIRGRATSRCITMRRITVSQTIRFEARRLMQVCDRIAHDAPQIGLDHLARPVFIIGVPRSGTSVLTRMLLSHPDIGGFPQEGNHLWHPKLYPWHIQADGAHVAPYEIAPEHFSRHSLSLWTPADRERIRATLGVAQFLCGTSVIINKSAMLCFMVPHILSVFPEAKLIHVVRDGRAAAYSRMIKEGEKMDTHAKIYQQRGYLLSRNELLEYAARAWQDSIDEIANQDARHTLSDREILLEVRYEDLCAQPSETLARLTEFIGVDVLGGPAQKIQFDSQNGKYRRELDGLAIERLTELMGPGLKLKGYLET